VRIQLCLLLALTEGINMIIQHKRCNHCGIGYSYYKSGISPSYNNKEYCNSCKEVIHKAEQEALKTIPIKYKEEWVECPKDEINLEEALKEFEKVHPPGTARRIYPPMFNLKTNDSTDTIHVSLNKADYKITYWHKSKELDTIEKHMLKDMETGEYFNY
jgi:hypothetical protein